MSELPQSVGPAPSAPAWVGPSLRSVAIGTLLVLLVGLGFWLLVELRNVLLTLFFGILLATALRPAVDWLRRTRLPRPLIAGALVLLLVSLALAFLIFTVPTAVQQALTLTQELPTFYGNLRNSLIESPYRIVRQFGYGLAVTMPTSEQSMATTLYQQGQIWLPSIGAGLFNMINALLITYYWLLYRERSVRGTLLLLPMAYRETSESLWLQIEATMGAFLRSQLVLMVTVGLASLVGFWIIGLPYALLMALAAGLLELVPFVGPIISTALAVAVGLSVSPELALGALVVGLIVQQIENNILAPRIVDKVLGISPVVTLLALVGFTALFGFIGTLLAIPLAAVMQVLFGHWLARNKREVAEPSVESRGMLSRLSYEVQDLAQDIRSHLRSKSGEVNRRSDQAEEQLEQILRDLDDLLQQEERVPSNS
jgi:predicted PurR-regulated permease PerM